MLLTAYLEMFHGSTLSEISNWSPYIFYVNFESKIRLYKIHASIINQGLAETLHFISLKNLVQLAQTVLEQRNPHFKKSQFLLQYEILHRDAIHLFFVCMKMFLTAVIKDEHASDDSLQSDSSFLLRNGMNTNSTSS